MLHLYSELKNEYISLRVKAANEETLLNAKILDALHTIVVRATTV